MKVLSTKYSASRSFEVSMTGSVRNYFNKHEQNVSDSISRWEVDYISFLPSL